MISVVLSTYNGERYLLEQLTSILNQTMKIDEVIISDDGSTDKTIEIIKKFIAENGCLHWVLHINQENKGWKRNFVEITSQAHGEYIFFCDQDDIWLNHKVEVMVKAMQNHKEIDLLAGMYIKFIDELPKETLIVNNGIKKATGSASYNTDFPGCVYCIRRSFWNKIASFWIDSYAHDAFSWSTASLFGTAYILEMPTIYWRRHAESTYTVYSKQIKSREKRVEWLNGIKNNVACLEKIANAYGVDKTTLDQLRGYRVFIELRVKLLLEFNILTLLDLLKHLYFYNKKRQLLLDVFLSIRKNERFLQRYGI